MVRPRSGKKTLQINDFGVRYPKIVSDRPEAGPYSKQKFYSPNKKVLDKWGHMLYG